MTNEQQKVRSSMDMRIFKYRYKIGERIPLWKGYVTTDYRTNEIIVAPILFNILIHWLRAVYFFIAAYPVEFERFRKEKRK